MNSPRGLRITIEDLPAQEQLTPEEMARILGAGRRSYQPTIEALENRQVPSATPTAIASALTHSQENYTNIVNQSYQQFLGRAPDSAGQAYWVAGMKNGLSDERLEAGFLGSPEYIQEHGGGGAGWVRGMYQDLLGRTPSNNEVNYWVEQLNQGVSTNTVAYDFAASREGEGLRVVADYQKLLGRMPSQNEVAYWVNTFESGQSNENVVAGFVGSSEFYNRAGGNINPAYWLESAYRDVLNRVPTEQESLAWVGRLAPGPTNGFLVPPQANVGQPLNQVPVFYFSDFDAGAQASQFTARIQTGDGTWLTSSANPQNIQVVANTGPGFEVLFSYTYTNALSNTTFAVTVTDARGVSIAGSTGSFIVWPTTLGSGTTGALQQGTGDDAAWIAACAAAQQAAALAAAQQAAADAAAQQAAQEAAAQQAAQDAAAQQTAQDAAAQQAAQDAAAQQAAQDAAAQQAAVDAAAQQAAQDAAAQQAAADAAAQQAAQDAAAQQTAADAAAQQAAQDSAAQQAAQDAAAQQAAAQQAAADAAAQQAAQQAAAQQAAQDAAAQQAAQQAAAQQAAQDAAAQQAAADAAAQQAAADAAAQQAAQDAAAQQAAQDAAAQQAAADAAAQQAAQDAAAQQAAQDAAAQQAAADAAAQQAAADAAAQQAAADAAAQQDDGW